MRRFSSAFNNNGISSHEPLTNDQIRAVAPSIFAEDKHESRSERYCYIPTVQILDGLRDEGFQPFSVVQTRVRDQGRQDYAKHMIRLRHASEIVSDSAKEIVLLNSHDGSSSYQTIAGVFRFVCANGHVFGDTTHDVRVRHKGDVVGDVIEGAFEVLDGFQKVDESMDTMKRLTLSGPEQRAFARAALTLKYDDPVKPAPITEDDVLSSRRFDDQGADIWKTFNRVQENLVRGGIRGRNANGKRTTTRPVAGIDQSVKLNRALWVLADEMAKLKR